MLACLQRPGPEMQTTRPNLLAWCRESQCSDSESLFTLHSHAEGLGGTPRWPAPHCTRSEAVPKQFSPPPGNAIDNCPVCRAEPGIQEPEAIGRPHEARGDLAKGGLQLRPDGL